MNDQAGISPMLSEEKLHAFLVTNVHVIMRIIIEAGLEILLIPIRTSVLAEKRPPHVVVDSDDVVLLLTEETNGFGTHESRRACYNHNRQLSTSPLTAGFRRCTRNAGGPALPYSFTDSS